MATNSKPDPHRFLDVDRDDLEEAWSRQPRLRDKYSARLADARFEYEEAKRALKLAVAELAVDMRENPTSYNLPKVTDKLIEDALPGTVQYQAALKFVNECRHAMDMVEAVVDAIDDRKWLLNALLHMEEGDLRSTPRSPSKEVGQNIKQRTAAKRGQRRIYDE